MTQALAWAAEWVLAPFMETGAERKGVEISAPRVQSLKCFGSTSREKRGPGAQEGERT